MQEVAAYSTVAVTLSLVVTRPRLTGEIRVRPAYAALGGVVLLLALGVVSLADVAGAASELWSPFVAIAAIMTMTEVATRVGLLDWWAARVDAGAETTAGLFALVFALGALTASALNNDAAILLLTPLVVRLVRRRFPDRPALVLPFAFAVFMAAGVAPLVVSNPMNMVVADVMGIGFNTYALRMAPIAVAGWAIAFLVLRVLFRDELRGRSAPVETPAPASGAQRAMMALLAAVLLSYSLVGYLGGPVWAVASAGAAASLALARRHRRGNPIEVVGRGVAWRTLLFLMCVLILATGLLNVGLVDHLISHYAGADAATVGVTSALGSAALNNHPMAYLNMLALEAAPVHGDAGVLAALIGGDLGPRLLPMGSLAGLLWLEALRRQGVHISLRQFVAIGAAVTVPSLAASLALLAALT